MRAILLAAGIGSRLKPITNKIPKCLVPIGGKPLLAIWIEKLLKARIESVLVNTHYFHEMVEDFICSQNYQNSVATVYEDELLGTAGTLIENINFYGGDDGMLIHADNFCMDDIEALRTAHYQRPKHCLLTMMTFRSKTPSSCGVLIVDKEGVVTEFHEKVEFPPGDLANGAVYILSPELIKMIRTEFPAAKDFTTDILVKLLGRIYTYETHEIFIDIGTPESYALACGV